MSNPGKRWEQQNVQGIKAIKDLNLQEDDWSKNIVVAHKRLIVMHQFDVNVEIFLPTLELNKLDKSGAKRKFFTAHYNMGDEHIYVLGGKDSCNLHIVSKC
jgi:hypothetical protein